MKEKIRIIIIGLCLIELDQGIKWLVMSHFNLFDSKLIIPNFFSLTYVRNTGAAFSMLEGKLSFFVLLSIAVLVYFVYFLFQSKTIKLSYQFVYSLLLGGIIGNLIDRIAYGAVVDYLDFQFGSYQFAIFNFADICIVIGGILLFLLIWKDETHEIHDRRREHIKKN